MSAIATAIAQQIIDQLQQGVKPWIQPWSVSRATTALPHRATGETYRGINVLLLWVATAAHGYTSPIWMTYRQAGVLGGQVRRGSTGTVVVYYGSAPEKEGARGADDGAACAGNYRFLKSYRVFNCDQIEGLPGRFAAEPSASPTHDGAERIDRLEAAFDRVGAAVNRGGDRAFYRPADDIIQMPPIERFRDAEQFYATLAHEMAHWTGGEKRLQRVFGTRFGDQAYAAEECVAELASAIIGSHAGLRPDHISDHAAYIAHWITAMKADAGYILNCASLAQAAADYVVERARFVVVDESAATKLAA
jgi:antirestriction protein ArdC